MIIIWFGLLVEILMLTLIKALNLDFESVAIVAVLVHVLFSTILLLNNKSKYRLIFTGAYLARVVLMFWDIYAKHIFNLPGSGEDTERFYWIAVKLSENVSAIFSSHYELYPKLKGFLFYFIGTQRAMGQYINVLLGLSVVFILYKVVKILEIDTKVEKVIILIAAFFPNSLIMSAIFLREMFSTFFVVASLYFFIQWFNKPKYKYMILTLIMLGVSCMFHSGVIGILLGYVFAFLFYKKSYNKFKFSANTVIYFILILAICYTGYTYFENLILRKFRNVENIDSIIEATNSRIGGSAYLLWLNINNPFMLVLFTPLKVFFFLTSPLPINWRGLADILTFCLDSFLYLSVILYLIVNMKRFGNRRQLIAVIGLMILGAAIIYSVGVSNAGTALRHRQKLVPLFMVLLGIMMDGKNDLYKLKKNGINLRHNK